MLRRPPRPTLFPYTTLFRSATRWSFAAATTAVGWRAYTSWANDGPDSTAIFAVLGSTSPRTHDIVLSRSGSNPFETLTTTAPRATPAAARAMTSRTAWHGAADTTTSAPRTVSATSPLARSAGASAAPGRNTGFRWSRSTCSTTSGPRAQSVTD